MLIHSRLLCQQDEPDGNRVPPARVHQGYQLRRPSIIDFRNFTDKKMAFLPMRGPGGKGRAEPRVPSPRSAKRTERRVHSTSVAGGGTAQLGRR